jgi:hypothetical protein
MGRGPEQEGGRGCTRAQRDGLGTGVKDCKRERDQKKNSQGKERRRGVKIAGDEGSSHGQDWAGKETDALPCSVLLAPSFWLSLALSHSVSPPQGLAVRKSGPQR